MSKSFGLSFKPLLRKGVREKNPLVEVTVKNKKENSSDFCLNTSKKSASVVERGGGVTSPPPLTSILFHSGPMGISYINYIRFILLLGVSFMLLHGNPESNFHIR